MFKYNEIGIDLGSHSIKIAIVEEKGKNNKNVEFTKLKEHKVYPVDCESYSKDYYLLLKNAVKDFSKRYKKRKLSLNISIPLDNKNTFINFMRMPVVEKKLMNDGVNFEAEQAMANEGIENSYFTWKIVNEDKELNEYDILLATVKKDVIDSLAEFKTIKWRINKVILQPIILERIADFNDIVLDFGYESIRIYFYKDGKLSDVEILDIGGKDILKKIKNYLDDNLIKDIKAEDIIKEVSVYNEKIQEFALEDQAEEDWYETEGSYKEEDDEDSVSLPKYTEDEEKDFLAGFEITDEENNHQGGEGYFEVESDDDYFEETEEEKREKMLSEISSSIEKEVKKIIDETKRVVRMLELKNGIDIGKVYYFGEISNLTYFKETIEAQLEMDLKPLDMLDINDEKDLTLFSIASLIAMGKEINDNTNFTKYIKANVDYTSLIVVLLTIGLSTGLSLKMTNDDYENQINDLNNLRNSQVQTISSVENDISTVQNQLFENEEFINKIEMLNSQKKWLSDILYIIPERTPLTVAINDLDIKENRIIIKGYSADYSSIGFFAEELEEIGTANIDSINDYQKENVFTVTLDEPELISDKYEITKEFQMTLNYDGPFLER